MSWPQAQEYNEAIQNPRTCFHDADLKQGTVKNNAMGIPVAISGGFASVYQLTTPSGKWAIRCFIREVEDSQRRYTDISKTLNSLRLSYTAPFEFQQAGIRVGSRSYPIVKMQWMTGELLSDYVAKNIFNQPLMAQLADKWAKLMTDLRNNKIAHGDLQHGNVVIVNDEIKLIDYDGMFVPSFQGMRSNEVGHPNFQHPRRKETDFGLYTDNFSAWVIYASLRILATSPELYNLSRGLGRDECLIFNREDYANPSVSPVFSELRLHQDDTVVRLAQQITAFLAQAPKDVPHLDTSAFPAPVITPVGTTGSEWWRDHIKETPAAEAPPPPLPPLSVEIGPQSKAQREIIAAIVASCIAFIAGRTGAIGMAGYGIMQVAAVIVAERRLRYHFSVSPAGAARDRHFQEVHFKEEETTEKKTRLEQTRTKVTGNEQQEKTLAAAMQSGVAEITGIQGAEIKQAYSDQAVARAELARRKQTLAAEEERDFWAAVGQFDLQLRNVQNQINSLPTRKDDFCREALQKERAATMSNFLSKNPISEATITGIGTKYKLSLQYRGIATAADVTFANVRVVPGFGHARTSSIVAWREGLELHYQSRMPTRLSPSFIKQIEDQFRVKKTELENELRTLQATITNARTRVTQAYDTRRSQLAAEEQAITATAQARVNAINAKYSGQIASLRTDFEQRQRNLRKDTANARVSINNLESDIRRLQTWQREVGTPMKKSYDEFFTFPKYVHSVFTSKIAS